MAQKLTWFLSSIMRSSLSKLSPVYSQYIRISLEFMALLLTTQILNILTEKREGGQKKEAC